MFDAVGQGPPSCEARICWKSLIVAGGIEDGRISLTLDRDARLAVLGALHWIASGVKSKRLCRDFRTFVGIDRADCIALLRRMPGARSSPAPRMVWLSQAELLAIELAMALTADGPFAEDVHTVTGVDETSYRRSIKALQAIFQTWVTVAMKTSP